MKKRILSLIGILLLSKHILASGSYLASHELVVSSGSITLTTGASKSPAYGLLMTAPNSNFFYMMPSLSVGAYNSITASNDMGIIYSNGSINGTSAGLVIAPWNNGTKGIRMDYNGNVGIGTSIPYSTFEVATGSIVAATGVTSTAPTGPSGGIIWRPDPGAGSGDQAWIRYGVMSGETTKLQIGINNDADDNIELFQGGAARLNIYSGLVGIGITNPSTYLLYVNGTARCTTLTQTSDKKFKEKIIPLDKSLDKVNHLHGVYYYWRKKEFPDKNFEEGRQIGFIAQDVEKILPEIVRSEKNGEKSMDYAKITAVLVEAVKELSEKNQKLTQQIIKIQTELKTLKKVK